MRDFTSERPTCCEPRLTVETGSRTVIQGSKLGARIMRYELTDHEWAAIKPMQSSPLKGILPHIFGVLSDIGNSLRYATPNIHPSTCATARSGGVSSGLRNAASVPSWSARVLAQAARFQSTCFLCITSIWRENNVADQPPDRIR